ncbi:MAG: chemotaxis protein CheW [Magnetococcales bacterium]|nr:chemotaxis protein CheW [Magnetococcales bacterium]NGZ26479.1 chemotaxis protein CheW [Magnetococcales bacterium]
MSHAILSETTQFLTFNLANEVFAVEISQVKEVLEYTTMTKVPRVPDFMRGVINLRGSVVPVVDLRLKLGMEAAEITVNTCIIIIEVPVDEERVVIGAMADSVKEVRDLEPNQVEPPPKIGTNLRADFIRGMGKQEGNFIILLNTDRVFSFDELELLQQQAD